jgi:serine/threonine protein kinase
MEQLGKNLEDQYNNCKRKFSLKTVLMLGDQLISILQYYHFKNYVHRAIRPSNFLMGLGKKNHKVFMIDYTTTKRYRDIKSLEHNPLK